MPSELDQIRNVFQSSQIPLSTEWLESCIEWCKSGNLPPNYTLKDLQFMVYEQWLILDLRDVEISSLPRNLNQEKKFSLTGTYYLQVMKIIDISKPKLWQLQRIRNKVGKNADPDNDFGKRVLQLTLTDGVHEIEAMEFKPITCININTTPGTKLKITGPIMVRNGRLMLESDNVTNVGGSVDDLIVKNAAENVIARALGLEENPNPHVIDEKLLEVAPANTQNPSGTQNYNAVNLNRNQNQLNRNPIQNAHQRNLVAQNVPRNLPNIGRTQVQKNTTVRNQEIPKEFQVDDELLRELEEDFEEESVRDFKKTITQPSNYTGTTIANNSAPHASNRSLCASPDLFEEIEFDDELLNEHLDQIDMESNTLSKNSTQRIGSLASSNNDTRGTGQKFGSVQDRAVSSSGQYNKPEIITLNDSFDDIDIDSHLDHIDEEMAKMPCSTQRARDIKNSSPELKCVTSTPKLTLAKPFGAKKVSQSKLTFGAKVGPGSSKGAFMFNDNDAFENPFMVSKKTPLDISEVSKKSAVIPKTDTCSQSSNASTELKYSPGTKVKILSIDKLQKLIPNISKGKFKIKAKFLKVSEKLISTESSFFLVITVKDDSGELVVEVHSDIVESFAGIPPKRLEELREKVLKKDVGAKSEINKALVSLQKRCISLDNILELQIIRGEKYPVLINVLDNV